ncbi:MAG: DUF975 family protein [Lachnospiraceae bacterium]|nr:DUF975 family protein [Lachnospiraceae bacterium]
MWSRKELKETAKERISLNHWKTVLVALVFTILCGGFGLFGSAGGFAGGLSDSDSSQEAKQESYEEDSLDSEIDIVLEDGFFLFFIVLFLIITLVVFVVLLIALPLNILVFNPLEIGVSRFFTRNLREQAQVKEMCFAFDRSYKNCVKVTFFRDLHILLWALLLIIPGIVKSYEYRLVPYILGECPNMERKEALNLSGNMMRGNKWKAFVLDLSFLGWYLLNGLTLGILGVFYLNPYVCQTDAALYAALKEQYLQSGKISG